MNIGHIDLILAIVYVYRVPGKGLQRNLRWFWLLLSLKSGEAFLLEVLKACTLFVCTKGQDQSLHDEGLENGCIS